MTQEALITRAQAKAAGLLHYNGGKPCKHGHTGNRLVSNGACCRCMVEKGHKEATKQRRKAYRDLNVETIRAKQNAAYAANPDPIKKRMAKRYAEKKDEVLAMNRAYQRKNRDTLRVYIREYVKSRRRSDEGFRLKAIIRNILSRSMREGAHKKSERTSDLLGYTAQQLRDHITPMLARGMTWDNYGKWHIDHRRPLSSFDLSTLDGIRLANSLHNLQPMWAKKNLQKHAKWEGQLTLV
jgi:hypothetical protein